MFLETRNYGFNEIIKRYACYPWYLPLPAHFEHGWAPNVLPTDLDTSRPLMLVFSARKAHEWKRQSKKPVFVIGSPFSIYKKMNQLKQSSSAKGTVCFPAHSTYGLKSQFKIQEYCDELKKLPENFKPITICLFWFDYIDKSSDIYRQNGFKVVTAGSKFSIGLSFVKKFYEILANHKYATSNEIGSQTFHTVDFGLPFFLTGLRSKVVSLGKDKDLTRVDDYPVGKIATKLFDCGPITKITPQQKRFVDNQTGVGDRISSSALRKILFQYGQSYLSWPRITAYIVESIILRVVLNGPWGKFVISLRRKLLKI